MDTEGLVIVAQVTGASVQDHHQVYQLVAAGRERTGRLVKVWVDEGYQGKEVAQAIKDDLAVDLEIIPKPSGQKGFVLVPRRWVVERTFAWFDNDRRLCRNYEVSFDAAEQMVKISAIKLLLNKI